MTRAYVDRQVYTEVRDDGHPVVIMTGADIAWLLTDYGIRPAEQIVDWLQTNFPPMT
jgi:hypothetical protein